MARGTFPAPTGCKVVLRQFAAQVVFVVFQPAALQRVSIGGDSLFRCSVMPHHVRVRVASGSPTIAGVRWCLSNRQPVYFVFNCERRVKSSYQSITFLFTRSFSPSYFAVVAEKDQRYFVTCVDLADKVSPNSYESFGID